uniref:U3 small nucleolar RNA-associated protein 25 n=1 Tax=Panagrolaimus sp. ES5 TaxID=591445 RepID=A0AC34GNC0_9BILA
MKRIHLKSSNGTKNVTETKKPKVIDFFSDHFCKNLEDALSEKVNAGAESSKKTLKSDLFEDCNVTVNSTAASHIHCTNPSKIYDLDELNLNPKILQNFLNHNKDVTEEQKELYQIIGRYMDLCLISDRKDYLPLLSLHVVNHLTRTRDAIIESNAKLEKQSKSGESTDEKLVEECRDQGLARPKPLLSLHVVNHLTRTRDTIIESNAKLEKQSKSGESTDEKIVEECRDQGLARPKVLFITSMKKYAYEFVHALADVTFAEKDKRTIMNSQRFEDEFGDTGYVPPSKRNEDFRELMSGNIDDCFRLGIQYAKKALKLYQKFSEADVLVCSPLGLRMIVGEEGEAEREVDFLASIEIVIVDKTNQILMQNWEHLQHILDEANGMPSKLEVDISRVRHWSLQNLGKIYRQTLIFSEFNFTELHALYASACKNYAGGVFIVKSPEPILDMIEKPLIQEFHRFDCDIPKYQSDLRFEYFTKNILPSLEHGTLIFVSSYFDFIRLRNYMKKEGGVFIVKNPEPVLDMIEKPLIQEFHRFDCDIPKYQSDLRFEYFTKNILPSLEHGTLIFVSSYFDFIRLRNYMKKEGESFVQLHEYAKDKKIARARGMFYQRRKKLIVMTERFYYFKRYFIKNVASLVFYQLPVNAKFFIELVNDSSPEGRLESKVIFSKYDFFRMQNIFGNEQAKQLIKSEKKFHALVSE